jgi:hypothetical protein
VRVYEARFLAGLKERHPVSKNMSDKDFRNIKDKLRDATAKDLTAGD